MLIGNVFILQLKDTLNENSFISEFNFLMVCVC